MARKNPAASETLDEIQSAADRLGHWIQQNLVIVSCGILGVLALAGIATLIARADDRREEVASTALAETRAAYFEAMGAPPGAIEVPELANKEAAKRIQAEYRERFEQVAKDHPGTVSGALAHLEAAQLALDAGDRAGADAIYQQVLEEDVDGDRLRGIVLQRIAESLEDSGKWAEAADRHEQAADLKNYPLRDWALADAARCRVMAGDRAAALALFRRLDSEAPDLRLPDHLRVEKREIEAGALADATGG